MFSNTFLMTECYIWCTIPWLVFASAPINKESLRPHSDLLREIAPNLYDVGWHPIDRTPDWPSTTNDVWFA